LLAVHKNGRRALGPDRRRALVECVRDEVTVKRLSVAGATGVDAGECRFRPNSSSDPATTEFVIEGTVSAGSLRPGWK